MPSLLQRSSIRRVAYRNPREPTLPVEVLALAELRRKAPAGFLERPQRPDFHQIHVVTRGRCALEVDFARIVLGRGAVVWVHPGQVLRFDLHAGVEGWLLMFTADVLETVIADDPVGPLIELGKGSGRTDVAWLLDRVRKISEEDADPVRAPLLRHLLHALLLTLQRAATSAKPARAATPVFELFRREVERRFATTRRIADYERAIGYSSKTLTRATSAATGWNAKQYIDQRVLLESRRLLAHTDASVSEIAASVGFSEATNFIKFFRREGGESPTEFRRRGSRPATKQPEESEPDERKR